MKKPITVEDRFDYLQSKLLETNESCTINQDEVNNRSELFDSIKNNATEISQSAGEIIFRFTTDHKLAHKIVDFSIKERECCNFFDFNLAFSDDLDTFDFHISSNSLDPSKFDTIISTMLNS